jgi:hypothetical protein
MRTSRAIRLVGVRPQPERKMLNDLDVFVHRAHSCPCNDEHQGETDADQERDDKDPHEDDDE